MDCFDRWASGWVHHGYAAVFVGPSWSFMGVFIAPEYAGRVNQMAADLAKQRALSHASNLVDAERFEDAAKIYESLGMWKEAGEIRRAGRRQVVTQVSVDINELIDQMRSGGLTAVYACPACGSHLTISGDSAPSSLRSCAYCGAAIQAADLADVLTKAIGYR